MTYYVTGMIQAMLYEFQLDLPITSSAVLVQGHRITFAGRVVLSSSVASVYRLVAGRASWRRLLSSIPLIGPLWYWSGIAEWTSLMSVLLKHQIRLPDALRLAGYGTRDEQIGRVSRQLADDDRGAAVCQS